MISRGQMINCGMLWLIESALQFHADLEQWLWAKVIDGNLPKLALLLEG